MHGWPELPEHHAAVLRCSAVCLRPFAHRLLFSRGANSCLRYPFPDTTTLNEGSYHFLLRIGVLWVVVLSNVVLLGKVHWKRKVNKLPVEAVPCMAHRSIRVCVPRAGNIAFV